MLNVADRITAPTGLSMVTEVGCRASVILVEETVDNMLAASSLADKAMEVAAVNVTNERAG